MAEHRVALTFDAEHPSRPHCPPNVTEDILRVLSEKGVRATFFLQGRWVTAQPAVARSIAEAGHLVGNHSHYHARFSSLSPEGVREDLRQAEAAIALATGADPKPWFRFPFGDAEDDAGIAAILLAAGYQHVGWHVDPNDWDASRTAEEVQRAVVEGAAAHGEGAVILLHAWPATTLEALGGIVAGLRATGATLVGLDELSSLPSGAVPRPY
jgi:peptidoglycan/xylan/chitin deacetylase (PgdA/CDA1 family)